MGRRPVPDADQVRRDSAASRPTRWRASDGSYTFEIDGDGAYSVFKFEGGTHRVQRVPETESQGRIHTSTATVAVLPEAEDVDVADRPERPADRRLPLRAGRAASRSTRRTRPCASPTSRPASSSPCRTRSRSCRTARRRCACCARGCTRRAASAQRRAVGRPQAAGRLGRARGEDPHLQLPRAAGHRPPHQAHRAQPRRDPAGRAGRVHRRAAGRREAPGAARHPLRPDPRRQRDARGLGAADRRTSRGEAVAPALPIEDREATFADYAASRARRRRDRRALDGRHHRVDRRGALRRPRRLRRGAAAAGRRRARGLFAEHAVPGRCELERRDGLDYFTDDGRAGARPGPGAPARPGGHAVLRAARRPDARHVHRLRARPRGAAGLPGARSRDDDARLRAPAADASARRRWRRCCDAGRGGRAARRRGVDTPRLDAEVLLAHALGVDRTELFLRPPRAAAPPFARAGRAAGRARAGRLHHRTKGFRRLELPSTRAC